MDQEKSLNAWLLYHPWVTYILIFVCLVYIYNKVFRVRKLPLLKEFIVYALLALGSFMLLIFSTKLPVVYSLLSIIAAMLLLRVRNFFTNRANRTKSKQEQIKVQRGDRS
ncbi:MAG TPA: YlaH-like family protein [Bacilli bacterium]